LQQTVFLNNTPPFHYFLFIVVFSFLIVTASIFPVFAQLCTNNSPITHTCVEEGLRLQREALRKLPENQIGIPETHLRLAEMLMHLGDPNGSIEEYQTAIRLNPEMAEAFIGMGAVYLDKHEWRSAEEALGRSIQLKPLDNQAQYWMGRTLLAQQNFPGAINAFTLATKLDEKDVEALSDLALAYMAQGEKIKASDTLQRAIQRQPDFAEAHHRLERVRASQGDSKQLILLANRILHTLFRRE